MIPEAVDVELFDRKSAKLVKPPWSGNAMCGEEVTVIDKEQDGASSRPVFEFLSVFKWERRKGWDVLLDAYWQEFSPDDEVLLRLHSYVPSWVRGETNITRILEEYAYKKYGKSLDEVAAVVWDTEGNDSSGLSRADVRDLYASADAFVLPTRGEGWGLPIAEAMAMELPVIVSNFSGPAAFANDTNAYMIPMTGNFDELGFALPSKDALRYIMRQVIRDSCPISGGGLTVAARRAHLGRASIAWWSPDRVVEAMSVRLKVLAQQRGYYA